jgi:hypothetical protein
MLLTKETQRNLFLIPLEVMSFCHKVDEVLEILTLKQKPLEIIRRYQMTRRMKKECFVLKAFETLCFSPERKEIK